MLQRWWQYINLARINKPAGFLLTFYPALLGSLYASTWQFEYYIIIKLMLGGIFARSFGCVINDIFDAQFDKLTTRTQDRPIASDQIKKLHAVIFAAILGLCSFTILLSFNITTIIVGVCVAPFIVLYPLTKRFFILPQLVLGLVFNAGVFIGYTAIKAELNTTLILLYLGCVSTTLIYDTIYATQDKEHDIQNGLKSSTITLQGNLTAWLLLFNFFTHILFVIFGYLVGKNFGFFYLLSFVMFYWSYRIISFKNPAREFNMFVLFYSIIAILFVIF